MDTYTLKGLVRSDWRPKEHFPSLKDAKQISLDLETRDDGLNRGRGPGHIRGEGHIVGFSLATDDGFSGYYPLYHKGGDNLEYPEKVKVWLQDQLLGNQPKIGANILYDLLWLHCDWGIKVNGPKFDIQIAEPLLDENKLSYRLELLAQQYLGQSKVEELMLKVGKLFYDIKVRGETQKQKDNAIIKQMKSKIWELPARYIGPYGEADATLPVDIFNLQKKRLEEEGLWNLFLVESKIVDVLMSMQLKGIPVDVEKGHRIREELANEYDKVMRGIKRRCGFMPNVWAAEDIVKCCSTLGLEYPKTEKGNPSFPAAWLAKQEHKFFKSLLKARQLDRSGAVFIQTKILDLAHNGRVHPNFWQVKNDSHGTVSGRFSSSNPNAQQYPSRSWLAPIVRSIMVPEDGCQWGVLDYSQQEPRVTVHYAFLQGLKGAEEARNKYINDPSTDYHQMIADMAEIDRKQAKALNLGLSYGMGKPRVAEELGLPFNEAMKIYNQYHEKVPYIGALGRMVQGAAKQRGYIKTLLGRKRHFDLYGPTKWSKGIIPKKYDEALAEFGRPVQRYFIHKAFNSLIQGSSADMIKKSLIDLHDAGYTPAMTIHDENDFVDIENMKQVKEIHEIMLNCVKLEVPMKIDIELGPNWGEVKEINLEEVA